MNLISIAIDGPAGAGKSTIAKRIAEIMNLLYIDTGAMYRAITLKLLNKNISFADKKMIEKILKNTKIQFINNCIFLDGINVNEEIRKPMINENVSKIAALPFVRERLVKLQRDIAKNNNVIMDGRDIGTRVLPDAKYKFFLTASINERAKRRFMELKEKGYDYSYDEIVKEITNRDKMDSERAFDPLKKAEDAILIDTTGKDIDEVINIILSKIRKIN
ncbi:(d)CMP kinase [Paramaledivibacter caminithermalis]|uniref:Cytidylate kinase n=1 Tax=Paramaledivibacter caminithermalis (strain DSM 15212 / CIP 107654 / DViRD3) TaxID=1121301 RepID=A0A1M6JLU1_PARC5|nr:(d)CMP kinase [Paramaledivibacter caminithermalis]SHJ47675.1 cytidylate kinase [Paramaledivibacter caminithermalis DSM 15212]